MGMLYTKKKKINESEENKMEFVFEVRVEYNNDKINDFVESIVDELKEQLKKKGKRKIWKKFIVPIVANL